MGLNLSSVYMETDCESCQFALRKLKEMEATKDKRFYISRDRKTGEWARTFVLRPDYNSAGILTHWHIELGDEWYAECEDCGTTELKTALEEVVFDDEDNKLLCRECSSKAEVEADMEADMADEAMWEGYTSDRV